MMREYVKAEMEILIFDSGNIVVTSGYDPDDDATEIIGAPMNL